MANNLGDADRSRCSASKPEPRRLQLGVTELNFVQGPDDIVSVWRSKMLEAKAVTCFSVRQFFNTPRRAMKIYHEDDSGINLQPHPKSNQPWKDRYYFHTRKETVGFFNGPGLKHFGDRFQQLLKRDVASLQVGPEWTDQSDLYSFIQYLIIGPAIEAMCGPRLLERNPTFAQDFWQFDIDMLYFFKGWPRLLAPRAWRNRTRILNNLKDWHAHAKEHFTENCVESDGHDPFYGSPLMRRRAEYLAQMDGLDADALASQDLGLIWAENANSIPAVFWSIVEILRQPHLLKEVLAEVVSSEPQPGSVNTLLSRTTTLNPTSAIESLCSKPYLQSIYAETLRLYTSLFALRSVAHEDMLLGKWRIPEGKLIAVDSRVAHMNHEVWNTGSKVSAPKHSDEDEDREGSHPLSRFWAERFLEYPSEPTSGPLSLRFRATKPRLSASSTFQLPPSHLMRSSPNSPNFTMEGLSGAWLPFGGGSRQCPGKNFAKMEIILSIAEILGNLEIELTADEGKGYATPDMKYYGLGTFPPKGKVRARIRRRVRV